MQVEHLKALYDDTSKVQRWANLLYAEVMGQNFYFHRHRKFPENQREFVLGFLENPKAALTL